MQASPKAPTRIRAARRLRALLDPQAADALLGSMPAQSAVRRSR
jgi:hypothetical protein